MELWEQIALGAAAILVLFWFGPGVKKAIERSREAEGKDWASVAVPLGLVVAFVILLLYLA